MENKQKIIIADGSGKDMAILLPLLNEIIKAKFELALVSSDSQLARYFGEIGSPVHKAYAAKIKNNFLSCLAFTLLYPFQFFFNLFLFIKLKKTTAINSIICLSDNLKFVLTPIAQLLKIRVLWLEFPEKNYRDAPLVCSRFYRILAPRAEMVIFSDHTKQKLAAFKAAPKKFHLIAPCIIPGQFQHQDTIFEKIAQNDNKNFRKKFFTIGTVVDLGRHQKLELLFQSVRTCLSVIPNIQLVVVGEGKERKELIWLAKKMQIDNLVWFVGEQKSLKKWLASFDMYVVSTDTPGIRDLQITLSALSGALPVIGPKGLGFENFIEENKTGVLLEMDNSEMLSRQIIKLFQDQRLREELGKNAKQWFENNYSSEKINGDIVRIFG